MYFDTGSSRASLPSSTSNHCGDRGDGLRHRIDLENRVRRPSAAPVSGSRTPETFEIDRLAVLLDQQKSRRESCLSRLRCECNRQYDQGPRVRKLARAALGTAAPGIRLATSCGQPPIKKIASAAATRRPPRQNVSSPTISWAICSRVRWTRWRSEGVLLKQHEEHVLLGVDSPSRSRRRCPLTKKLR